MSTMYHLDTCVWEITHRCNFNCEYCGSKAGLGMPDELSTEKCIDIAEQLIALSCRRVVLIGGEVFLKTGWEQIASVLIRNNIDCSIITNGFLINNELICKLLKTGIRHISVSIDGTKEIHDKFRRYGSFDKAISAIKLLKNYGFIVSVISTLNSESIDTVEGLYSELKKLNIDAWQLQCCSPFGNANEKRQLVPSRDQLQWVCQFVSKCNKKLNFQIAIADNIGYHSSLEDSIRGNKSITFTGCSAGLTTIGIDSVGNVRGCESLYDDAFIEGNLLNDNLYDIWTSLDNFSYNRKFDKKMLLGNCKKCDVWYKCAAGCRSFNYFYCGNMYMSPLCLKGGIRNEM